MNDLMKKNIWNLKTHGKFNLLIFVVINMT